jgi:hypothetical protein
VGRFDSRRWWTVLPLIPFTNALNRGESYHKLVRAAAYANGGKLRVRTDQEQQLWSECSRLLANCIIYYNACILSELLERAERRQDYQRGSRPKVHHHCLYFAIRGRSASGDRNSEHIRRFLVEEAARFVFRDLVNESPHGSFLDFAPGLRAEIIRLFSTP